MKKLSIGARLSWQLASWEAAIAKQRYIEIEHILLGLLSLKKTTNLETHKNLEEEHKQKLLSEQVAIENLIQGLGITTTSLRRHLRHKLSRGKFKHKEKIVHRSEACKNTFQQAEKLSKDGFEVNVLNLLVAIMARPNAIIEDVLNEFGVTPQKLLRMASSYDIDRFDIEQTGDLDKTDYASIHSFTRTTNVSRLTIVFDDIVGSTALFHKLGDEEFFKLLKYHDETIKKVIRQKGRGEIVKSTGDGFLMVFSSPVVAVECALNIQKELLSHRILRVRIGMDMGEVKQVLDEKSRDIFGIKVSTASRITGAALGGHVLTSRSVWEETHSRIKHNEISWRYLGARSFKPGEPTIDIYEVYHTKYLEKPMEKLPEISAITEKRTKLFPSNKTPYLDQFGRDLTEEARAGKLGPFAGRRSEILQVIQTLSQKYSNNPLLVGRAGVGKTSLIESLAIRMAMAKDCKKLSEKRIISLNINDILAGTKDRNEFEDYIMKIIKEIEENNNIILFIDEIHNYIGIGTLDTQINIANLLNPVILKGKIHVIGTTTDEDFQKYIRIDSSLERGFQKIIIDEPSQQEILEMLQIFRKKLEEYHRIWITDRALEAAIILSNKFDRDHALPAKAIDILDEAGAQVHIPDLSMVSEKSESDLGIDKGVAHTVLNVLSIAKVVSQKTGVPMRRIMETLGE